MPDDGDSSGNQNGNAYADPYYLANSDHSSSNQQLGIIIFNGENYLNWTRSIRMALGSRNKLGYIDGKIKKPNQGHADFGKWYRNDNAVRGWILASMTTNLAESLIYLETSKDLWDEVKERYGQTNAPLLYQLKKELSDLKQENQAVGNFYCKLKNLWDHISSIEGMPECTCGAMSKCTCNMMKKLADAESLNKLIQFLMALNEGLSTLFSSKRNKRKSLVT
ncbi:uncharacterized protein [Spinacia oleracea]|uniref:Retrotransposon Copia-like N-terminal domain-containing protein n=1 Tax=Spinacia oleracea TaxID=3562 RepID=A0ABM3R4I0_SPIOL|nr:uncharacterized protein LOC130461299 [Spinacia oleracea]XP_056690469.1 uncharacterized protein LOC130465649 [Spinacia oleracea]XP_056690524.1 uncharacterized protein LOC130465683 [Spinacia oleracea]